MPMAYPDRVKETTSTTGTGDLTLAGADVGYLSFDAGVSIGYNCDYCITSADGSWEVGLGYLLNSTTLQRVRVYKSSNANALVNFASGTKSVFATYSSESVEAASAASQTNVTAAGTNQATATALVDPITIVTTVAAGTGVRLPSAWRGRFYWVTNHGANTMLLYPATGDTVEGGAVNVPLPLLSGQTYKVCCPLDGQWDGYEIGTWDDEGVCYINLAKTSSPTAPPDGAVRTFDLLLGNKPHKAHIGSDGQTVVLSAADWWHKVMRWNPPGNATTVPGVDGMAALTAVGTATARNIATTNVLTRSSRLGYVSAATAGSLSGHYAAVAQYTTGTGTVGQGSGFFYSATFAATDAATVSGVRQFVGVSNSVAAPTNVEPSTLTNAIGIAQLSTDATQLYIVYGGSAAQTAIGLGVNFPPGSATATSGALYRLILASPENENGQVYYHVTNLSSGNVASGKLTAATPGTKLPSNTTLLAHRAWRSNNATALAVGIDMGMVQIRKPV